VKVRSGESTRTLKESVMHERLLDYLRAAHSGALGNEALGAARRACRLLPPVAVIVGIAMAAAVPAIDSARYVQAVRLATDYRAARRLTEDEFIALSRLPGTVILDARSGAKYDELHIRGAINLPFPDIALDSLAQLLPDKRTRILIYCNNNFANAPGPFPTKLPSASLNLATWTALYDYGYRNVYELGPLLDVKTTRIEFVGK
jgi:hypothetical protein